MKYTWAGWAFFSALLTPSYATADQRASYTLKGKVLLTVDATADGRGRIEFPVEPGLYYIIDKQGVYRVNRSAESLSVLRMEDLGKGTRLFFQALNDRGYFIKLTPLPEVVKIEKSGLKIINGVSGEVTKITYISDGATCTNEVVLSKDKNYGALSGVISKYFAGLAESSIQIGANTPQNSLENNISKIVLSGLPLIWPTAGLQLQSVQTTNRDSSDYELPASPLAPSVIAAGLEEGAASQAAAKGGRLRERSSE